MYCRALYRAGWPLPFVAEFLGHAKLSTTSIYAYADTEMKRKALEKTSTPTLTEKLESFIPIWKNDEEMILRLSGLQ